VSTTQQAADVYCYTAAAELKQQSDNVSVSESSQQLLLDAMSAADSDADSDAMESFDDFEDFCIIDEPGLGIMVRCHAQ